MSRENDEKISKVLNLLFINSRKIVSTEEKVEKAELHLEKKRKKLERLHQKEEQLRNVFDHHCSSKIRKSKTGKRSAKSVKILFHL